MKTMLIILFFLLPFTQCGFAQYSEDSIWLTGIPFEKGVILPNMYRSTTYADPSPFARIYSAKECVYSISASKVIRVFAIDDEWVVLTKGDANTFFTYTGLRNVSVKKSDDLKRGERLGLARKDDDTGMFMIGFGIYKAHMLCSRDEVTRFLRDLSATACITDMATY